MRRGTRLVGGESSGVSGPPVKSRAEVRGLTGRMETAAAQATELLSAPERLRPQAAALVTALLDRSIDARLAEVPIDELRPLLKPGTRLRPFETDGFDSVASILNASAQRLASVGGVGAQTAAHVRETAGQIRAGIAADLGFRFDPASRGTVQTDLLAHLTAIRSAEETARQLGQGPGALVEAASMLVPRARPVAGAVRRLLARKQTKAAAFTAAAQIEQRLTASGGLIERLVRALPLTDPRNHGAEEVWRRFHADAASYYSLLSGLGPVAMADETTSARGHLDPEFAQEIAETELDTRLVKSALRGYQRFGAQFALRRRRSILGDEMGLGKTVQALAACAHLAANGRKHFLVVCPLSVLLNWLAETEKHTLLDAHRLHGDDRDRQETARRWLREGGVAVTTFDTLPRLRSLAECAPTMLIVDEAHYVKNPETKRAQSILPFIDRSERTLFLSGTPMENRIGEFRDLVGYLQPRIAERLGHGPGLSGARSFRRKVAGVYLRRNQTDVLRELPERIEVEEWVLLTQQDLKVYRRILSGQLELGLLEKLRHAAYQSPDSAKLKRVLELVTEAADDGLKIVVFSRYLDVLARVRAELGELSHWVLKGSVPATRRQPLIDEFTRHEGPAVLLAQIETGGTGINLQSASAVILTEPQWKPSTEEQAIARLHRMGQVRNVQVHRILAKETVDELLLRTQERKRHLFDEFARKSDAKDADRRSTDTSTLPAILDDESIPLERRILLAEQDRLTRDQRS